MVVFRRPRRPAKVTRSMLSRSGLLLDRDVFVFSSALLSDSDSESDSGSVSISVSVSVRDGGLDVCVAISPTVRMDAAGV